MPSPRPAPKPAPPAAAAPAALPAPVAAAAGVAPDPFRLLPELPEGISLCFTFGGHGSSVTAEAYNTSGTELAGSGPVLVSDKDPAEAFALAAAVALYNAKGAALAVSEPAPAPVQPVPSAVQPPQPTDTSAAEQLLAQIAALPPEWQDYIGTTFAAQFGIDLPAAADLTPEQAAFTSALLPQ